VKLPQLTDWKFASEAPEAQLGFDDSDWTLADHPGSNASSPSTPVLYASDYGYDHGFVWYRGHFTATGSETGVTLTVDGIAPTGAYSVWLNGAFLGSGSAAGAQTQTFTFPSGILASGKDDTIAILVENTGNPEGPSGEKVGLYSASLVGSSAAISWRLMGDPGGSTLQDTVRGVMNPSGLFGADNGWDLPGYPDASWEVDAAHLLQRHPVTPYLGQKLTGSVRRVWLGGIETSTDGSPAGHLLTKERPARG